MDSKNAPNIMPKLHATPKIIMIVNLSPCIWDIENWEKYTELMLQVNKIIDLKNVGAFYLFMQICLMSFRTSWTIPSSSSSSRSSTVMLFRWALVHFETTVLEAIEIMDLHS